MGSSYYGEPNLGNERGGSSRKSKKSNSDKPKQPQRGLGVAQLEKIRLNGQLGCNYHHPSIHTPYPANFSQEDIRVQTGPYSIQSPSFSYSSSSSASSASYGLHPSVMMGIGDYERTNIRYSDSQPSAAASWHPGNDMFENPHFAHSSSSTGHLMNLPVENTRQKTSKKQRSNPMGSGSQNSDSNDSEELDLELRLSI